jgi:hypothetical protein
MTILNIANDGYYSNFVAICRAVAVNPPMPRDKLQELCAAGAESDSRTRQTLNRWIELRVLKDENGAIGFADPALEGRSLSEVTTLLPAVVRRIVFAEENNDRSHGHVRSQGSGLGAHRQFSGRCFESKV